MSNFKKNPLSSEFRNYIDGLVNCYGNIKVSDLKYDEQLELLSTVFIDDIEFDSDEVLHHKSYNVALKLYDLVNNRISPDRFRKELCDHLFDAYEDVMNDELCQSYIKYYTSEISSEDVDVGDYSAIEYMFDSKEHNNFIN